MESIYAPVLLPSVNPVGIDDNMVSTPTTSLGNKKDGLSFCLPPSMWNRLFRSTSSDIAYSFPIESPGITKKPPGASTNVKTNDMDTAAKHNI